MTSLLNRVEVEGVERRACFTEGWVEPGKWDTYDSFFNCCKKAAIEKDAFAWDVRAVVIDEMSCLNTESSGTQLESLINSNMVATDHKENEWDSTGPLTQVANFEMSLSERVT